MTESGTVTGLAHAGYGEDNTHELLDFYCDMLGIENRTFQEIKHNYITRINGVGCHHYRIGFVRIENDDGRLELVGFRRAVDGGDTLKGNAVYPFGTGGHMHLIYQTDNLWGYRWLMEERGVAIATGVARVDYGKYAGLDAFFIRDPNGVYVQIVGPAGDPDAPGRLNHFAGVSYLVTDMNECAECFTAGMGLEMAGFDVTGSAYLQSLGGEPPLRGMQLVVDSANNFNVELLEAARPNPKTREIWVNSIGCLHICFAVTGIHELHKRMSNAGIRFVGPPAPVEIGLNKGGTAIFAKISHEILVELFQGRPTAV